MFLTTDQLTLHSGKNLRKLSEKIEILMSLLFITAELILIEATNKKSLFWWKNQKCHNCEDNFSIFWRISGEIRISWVYWSSFNSSQAIFSFLYHKSLLITNRSWILTIHKDRIFCKNPWKQRNGFQKQSKKFTSCARVQYILLSMIYFNYVAFFDDFCHKDLCNVAFLSFLGILTCPAYQLGVWPVPTWPFLFNLLMFD